MRVLEEVVGALIVLATWASVLSVLVVPRPSRNRLSLLVNRAVAAVFRAVTSGLHDYSRRDRVLSWQAAVTLLGQLAAWLSLFYIGYALVLVGVEGHGAALAFDQAGSSLLTLGYAAPDGVPRSIVDYLAAATGLIVVALQIGYLPTLYGAFNRRETEVTLLAARAGSPAWGPEILARTRFGFTSDGDGAVMDEFYAQWERWAADVSESHTNYAVLTTFRSPAHRSSWLVALVAVLDSAALWLALSPGTAPLVEARLALRMGFGTLQAVAETLGIEVDRDPDPDSPLRLSYDEYLDGVQRIATTSFRMDRTPEQAWPDFRGWRVNYESVAYALAERLDAVPAPWTGPRRTGDAVMPPVRPPNRTPSPHDS